MDRLLTQPNRIVSLSASLQEIVVALADGNPGAVLAKILSNPMRLLMVVNLNNYSKL